MGGAIPVRREVRVNIGLDFGTSATKVVVRIDDPSGPPLFMVVGPDGAVETVLYPSVVAVEADHLLFGRAADESTSAIKVRSFKMNLPGEAGSQRHAWRGRIRLGETGLSAEHVCIFYLAWVLSDVLQQVRRVVGGADLKVTVNAAAPLDQIQDNPGLKAVFHRIVFHALSIYPRATGRWSLDDVLNLLTSDLLPTIPATDASPVTVFPETHAAVSAYMLQPGRAKGNYATVDVGAGSTDVAFFWFHATHDLPEMCYYGECSQFVGMDDIDRKIAMALHKTHYEARCLREGGVADPADHPSAVRDVIDQVCKCYRNAFGSAYKRNLGEREWQHRNGLANYTLCFVGGGSLCPALTHRVRQALPLPTMTDVNIEYLRVPDDLLVIGTTFRARAIGQIAPGEQPLLLLAHGLAHRAVDIPIFETNHTFSRVQYLAERPAHEELYAK